MVPDALPPFRHISSTPVPLTTASTILTTYIANSEIHAHLHPDALITPSGVSFSSHGGPSGGVVMHNLRRVAAGLRGEYLEPEATPEPEETGAQNDASGANGKKSVKSDAGNVQDEGAAAEGWQDMSEYERDEGGVEVGELGDRDHFVKSGGDAPPVQVTGVQEEVGTKRKAKDDKEARKKAKKERNKEFKRQKESQKKSKDEE